MPNLFLYAHGGSGNHGCEAIVRSTLKILSDVEVEHVYLITNCPAEDQKYGLSALCELLQEKNEYSKMSLAFIKAYLSLKLKKDYVPLDKLQYKVAFDRMRPGDIAVSIGGDNYCYADAQRYTQMHDMALARGAKTVLWGCSVEPELLSDRVITEDIARYSLITARERISYKALSVINQNTVHIPDPAFVLDYPVMDDDMIDNAVGINISPMAIANESIKGITIASFRRLMEFVLNKTDMNIVLIPHVVWEDGDDRIPLNQLYNYFSSANRVYIADDQSCKEIKGLISKCRFFIGARTHATIAAYSTAVPTLTVGYSVKARGIAQDLFGTDYNHVISVQSIKTDTALIDAFIWQMEHEDSIRTQLKTILPGYTCKAYEAASSLKMVIQND